jgi:peptidoglycan/xylan/chitin deacetylase (PgdA/CDA1 family)
MMSGAIKFAARQSLRHFLIRVGLEAVAFPGAGRLYPSAAGRGVIFTLHHVRPVLNHGFQPNALLSVTPEFLDEAVATVHRCGLHPVHLEDLPKILADSSDTRRFVCFTLDDGYRDNEQYAAPIFRKYNVPYTIFITPGFVERTRTMWWETAEELTRKTSSFAFDFGRGDENVRCSSRMEKLLAFERLATFVQNTDEDEAVARLDRAAKAFGINPEFIVDQEIMTERELQNLAMDPLVRFGAHTITHPNLKRVAAERLREELQQSAVRVAGYSGRAPKALAYPYGGKHAVGPREAKAAMEAGFTVAVTTQPGVLDSASLERPTELPRVSLNGHFQKSRYVRALASGLPFKLM